MKNHYEDKFRAKVFISNSAQDFSSNKGKIKKDKKNKQHKDKRDSTTPATRVIMTKVGEKKEKKRDTSEITYYNYNKKRHYPNLCPEPQKSKN